MLVILDRSKSVWAHDDPAKSVANRTSGCTHPRCRSNWVSALEFVQELAHTADGVAEGGVNVALGTFSSDLRMHFGFNAFYHQGGYAAGIAAAAQFPIDYPDGAPSEWVPHTHLGGRDLEVRRCAAAVRANHPPWRVSAAPPFSSLRTRPAKAPVASAWSGF